MDAEITTFRDMTEYVCDMLDVPISARNLRMARQAVMTAYRRLPNFTRWKMLERRATLLTTASQTTGSVAYDHTGGTYERMLTLTGTTWPTDAVEGKVVISNKAYSISERKTTTVVTLDLNSNPGADVAAGTTYTWYRSSYALPLDFRKMCRIWDVENTHEIPIVPTDTHHARSIDYYSEPDTPWEACIRGTGDYFNAMSIEFGPPPNTARYYDYLYEASPRPLSIEKYSTGTVTTLLTAVTGSATVFPTDCVGSIIRFGTTTYEPTGVTGSYDGSAWLDNRYVAQRVITGRTSSTAITIDSALTAEVSAVKYTISDPIDIFLPAMMVAFQRLAEAEFAKMTSHKQWAMKEQVALQEVRRAMEADQLATYSPAWSPYDKFSHVSVSTDT